MNFYRVRTFTKDYIRMLQILRETCIQDVVLDYNRQIRAESLKSPDIKFLGYVSYCLFSSEFGPEELNWKIVDDMISSNSALGHLVIEEISEFEFNESKKKYTKETTIQEPVLSPFKYILRK